jgi:hypothetical protein
VRTRIVPSCEPIATLLSRLPGPRKGLFAFLVACGLVGLMELGSRLIFRYHDAEAFSVSRLQRERKKILRANQTPLTLAAIGDRAYVPHPYLGVVLNYDWPLPIPGELPITEYGFCDTGPPIHKRAANKVIVAIVGGSVASGLACQGAGKILEHLKQVPAYAGKQLIAVNLAVHGHKQPQQVMALNYALALGGEFDLLINLDGFNEVALYPTWPRRMSPIYPRGWLETLRDIPGPEQRLLAGKCACYHEQREEWARAFMGWLRFSATANLIWRIGDRHLADKAQQSADALKARQRQALPHYITGPSHGLNTDEKMYRELVRIWHDSSVLLHRTCQANGIRYYHFLQPNQYDPGSKPMGPQEQKGAWSASEVVKPGVENGYPLLREAGKDLAKQGIRFHDLSRLFADHPEPLYRDTCCHLNKTGNEVLGDAIGKILVETAEPPRTATMPTP